MRFDIYQDAAGEWRWRVYSANNRIIADSSEGYERREGALEGFYLLGSMFMQPGNLFEAMKIKFSGKAKKL